MKYIVVGPTIINDIIFADGSKSKRHIGGSIFCVEGVKVWNDDCLYLTNAGEDFREFYGTWMDNNQCAYDGIQYTLPHTQYTTLVYGDEGLHSEVSIYGKEEEKLVEKLDVISAAKIARYCTKDTKGIYIEASETNPLWSELKELKAKVDAKIMWEIPTSAAMDEARKEDVIDAIKKVDIYSLNLPEALSLFHKETEEEVIQMILDMGVACFFRVGARGAYMIADGKYEFAESVTVGEVVDPTGCGNCSTAAAMYAFCEGYELKQVAFMANVAAAYNLLQYGPYPIINEEVRQKAWNIVNEKMSV